MVMVRPNSVHAAKKKLTKLVDKGNTMKSLIRLDVQTDPDIHSLCIRDIDNKIS